MVKKRNFTLIDNDFVEYAAMSGLTVIEWAYVEKVLKFAFNDRVPYPTQARLARMIGCSVRTVSAASRSLSRHKLQILTPRFNPKGKAASYIDVRPCIDAVRIFAEWYRKTILTMEKKDRYSSGAKLLIEQNRVKPLSPGRGGLKVAKLKVIEFKKREASEG